MRALLLSLALLASSCAGTCSAIGGGSIGHGAIGSGAIGSGAIGGPVATCDPFGSPDLAFMGCDIDGSLNATLATNDPVCTWHDSGSLGVDATQGTGTACPTFVEGGGPNGTQDAVTFDGGDFLATAAFAEEWTQPSMTAVVGRVTTGGGTNEYLFGGIVSTKRNDVFEGANLSLHAGSTFTTTQLVSGEWNTILGTFNGASSELRKNGASVVGNAGSQARTGMSIGSTYDGTAPLVGSIADVIGYRTPPTATDLEADLATHHASTFPVAP